MSTDYNTRAARGQALNLAVNYAIAEKKVQDRKFILHSVLYFLELSETVQELTIDELITEATKK